MADKRPISNCSIDTIIESVRVLRETSLPEAENIAADYLNKAFADKLNVTDQRRLAYRAEALGIGMEGVLKTAKEPAAKGMTEEFIPGSALPTVAKPGTVEYEREVRNLGALNQHSLVQSQARIVGATRKSYTGKTESPALRTAAVIEASARLGLSDANLRMMGLPLVTAKASILKGATHVSFLTFGDVTRLFVGDGSTDLLKQTVFRTADVNANVPFQNVAEAARRVIEHTDLDKPLDAAGTAELRAEVLDALENAIGRPIDAESKAAFDLTAKWLKTDEGQTAINAMADALTEPGMVAKLVAENTKQKMVSVALASGDGVRMTDQALQAIADLPWTGDRLTGYGQLVFGDGMKEIFGKDFLVALHPEQMNLAFSQRYLALAMNHIAPESLADLKVIHENIMAMKKSRAKGGKNRAARNKAKAQQMEDMGEQIQPKVEDEVANDPNVRVLEPSVEAATLAKRFYDEMQYGSVIGGFAKLISKVSDVATMGGRGKTILVGTEHRVLENAAIITAGLRKVADSIGQDHERANRVFNHLKSAIDNSAESKIAAINALPEADQQLASTMLEYIDAIFGVGNNNIMMQNGIFVDEVVKSLRTVGLARQADILEATGTIHPEDLANYWKQLEIGEGDKALELMSKYYAATQLSMIKPTVAASLIRHFGHQTEGLTHAEAVAQGWKEIADDTELGAFLRLGDKPTLFPPDIIPKLQQMNYYLDYHRGFKSDIIQKVWNQMDPVISVLKSSVTIWRPGHHMTSLMGNTFMNVLAGVGVHDYAYAVKLLAHKGDIDETDIQALNELMRANVPAGYQFKGGMEDNIPVVLTNPKTGKPYTQLLDMESTLKLIDGVAGVRISPRRAKDVVNEADPSAFSMATKLGANPAVKGVAAVDHQIARFAAARDNLARFSLFTKELRKGGPYRSLEDAAMAAAQKVHEFHPTVGTLTAEERKIARRFFYFYTWQKQAFFKMMELAANQPAMFTIPSKVQFAIATAQGLDPQSFGDPFSANGMWAAYNSNSVYGPQWDDPKYGAMGVKPSAPQLDVIDSYLSQFRVKPEDGLWGNIGNLTSSAAMGIIAENVTPAFRIPAELATKRRIGGIGGEITDVPQYLVDQTGFAALSKIYDWLPWGQRSDTKYDDFSNANRERQLWNYWTGAKFTFYESPAALQTARQEQIDYWRKVYGIGKYNNN